MPRLHLGRFALGVHGLALLRRWQTEAPDVADRRVEAMRALLGDAGGRALELEIMRRDAVAGYTAWATTYDLLPNPLIQVEEPVVRALLDDVPAGVALDAACGTGRWAAYLAGRGHRVVGVDATPAMLEVARACHPALDLREGTIESLPVADARADVVVCALALMHVAALAPAFAELARVLRPGGRLIVSDLHPAALLTGGGAFFAGADGSLGVVASHARGVGEYLTAALAGGFALRGCVEPGWREAQVPLIAGPVWPLAPDACRDAWCGFPAALVLDLVRR